MQYKLYLMLAPMKHNSVYNKGSQNGRYQTPRVNWTIQGVDKLSRDQMGSLNGQAVDE